MEFLTLLAFEKKTLAFIEDECDVEITYNGYGDMEYKARISVEFDRDEIQRLKDILSEKENVAFIEENL